MSLPPYPEPPRSAPVEEISPRFSITHLFSGGPLTLDPAVNEATIPIPDGFPSGHDGFPDTILSTCQPVNVADVPNFLFWGVGTGSTEDADGNTVEQVVISYAIAGTTPIDVNFNIVWTSQTVPAIREWYTPPTPPS
jgi:hypothetical protein